MSTWLLHIALGPVQGFIAAARSSRDLWAGSRLLSGLARSACQAVIAEGAGSGLIYPVKAQVENDQGGNLSNVILASIHAADESAVRRIVESVRAAVATHLNAMAGDAFDAFNRHGLVNSSLWEIQIADAFEFHAAWAPLEREDFAASVGQVKTALAARKNTRAFKPAFRRGMEQLGEGVAKSSLDGLRESVFAHSPDVRARRQLSLSDGEQLDALGCIKRYAGRSQDFTALSRIAAHHWINTLDASQQQRLREASEPLVADGLTSRCEGNQGCYAAYPYDAGLLFPERLELALENSVHDGIGTQSLKALQHTLRDIWSERGQPSPYAALLIADGDRMGRFLSTARDRTALSRISDAIAEFATRAPDILREHNGHCVYAGGEDVMALLPPADALSVSRHLSRVFQDCLRNTCEALSVAEADRPTLRVGIAICHVLEPYSRIRQYASEAEQLAKGEVGTSHQGNAVGIRLQVRAGHVHHWRARFDDAKRFAALDSFMSGFAAEELPGKLPYAVRGLAEECERAGLPDRVRAALLKETLRRRRGRGSDLAISAEWSTRLLDHAAACSAGDPLLSLATELIVARWLSASTPALDVGGVGS